MASDLQVAIVFNSEEEVARILQQHPELDVNSSTAWNHGWSPLHESASRGHPKIISLLLAHPAIDVNLPSRGG